MSNNPPALHPPIAKSRILRPEGLAPSARCPCCTKRGAFHDYLGVMDTFERYAVVEWQCIYCCSIVDRGVGGKPIWTGVIDNIVLRPGEMEELRPARAKTILAVPKEMP